MDLVEFCKKYPDLDTYDKYIEKIVELHKTILYHSNVRGKQVIIDRIEDIRKIKSKLEGSLTELIKFKNGFNKLDDHLIFEDKTYNEIVKEIRTISDRVYGLTVNLISPQNKYLAEVSIEPVLSERVSLRNFLDGLLRKDEEIRLNKNIIKLVTEENKPLNSIAKVDIMRKAYDEVVGNMLKADDNNKSTQLINEYKEYKRNQSKNQKGEVVKVVAEPIDTANPSDGRDVK